jgi:outer membrane protein assembly factor BamB
MRLLRQLSLSVLILAGMVLAASGVSSTGAAVGVPDGSSPVMHSAVITPSEWTTYNENGLRTGVDSSGSSFSTVTAAWTSPQLDGQLYGQPLVAAGRVYAATENDTVYALAADTGAVMWSTHVGTPFNRTTVPGLCGDINPTVGITSTPVIDTARSEIFVVADEQVSNDAAHHLIGIDLYTGAILLNEVVDPPGFDPAHELQRASLALSDGRIIIGFGGNAGDCEPYHGLVVSAPENGAAPTHFEVASARGDSEGAVWMGGGAPAIDASGNVWVSTGNSQFESSTDPYDNSDGVLELSPTMRLIQAFAPTSWPSDNASDLDLSTPPVILGNGLVFAIGKSSTAFVLNQTHLGGVGGELISRAACFGHGAAAHVGDVVYTGCGGGAEALRVSNDPATLTSLWSSNSGGGGTPIVAGGEVWTIGGGNLNELAITTGHTLDQFSLGSAASSFPSPSAADGLILAPATNSIKAFKGPGGLPAPPSAPPLRPGYWLVSADGGIFAFGSAPFFGSTGSLHLNRPVVGMATTPDHRGYWLVASDGGIFAFGDARFEGSTGSLTLNKPVVGMAATPDGRGYWLVASDGGIFAFGDARFEGSTGSLTLNKPVVGMAATPDGRGYWLVASDGGIFAFGDARFEGSTGSLTLNQPVVGMAATPDGRGYWLVASDGGIFAFGDARFEGSTGSLTLNKPVVGMAATPDGRGYWLVASDGGIFAFGDARFEGSTGSLTLNQPVVGMAATPQL